jgi:hypothetical protein
MKMNGKYELFAQIARRGLRLTALLVLVLGLANIGRAQSSSTPSNSSQVSRTHTAAQSGTQESSSFASTPQEKTHSNSAEHGVKVHGHWTIEIRNPDGVVEKHVEFENGICPTQTVTTAPFGSTLFGSTYTFPGGALTLSNLASGNASAGPWGLILGSSAALNTTTGVPAGCAVPPVDFYVNFSNSTSLIQSNASSAILTLCSNVGTSNQNPTKSSCFPTLNAAPMPSAATPTIALSGQFTAASAGSISLVSTVNFLCTTTTISPATCLAYQNNPAILTGTQLTGTNGVPGPQTYAAGQTVLASVVISFN